MAFCFKFGIQFTTLDMRGKSSGCWLW